MLRNSWARLSDGECVAGLGEINEVCNGLSKSGTRYLWRGEPHLFMGRHTRSAHTQIHIAVCQTKRIAGGVQMVPQFQNNRWIGTFLWCLPSPSALFTAGNMRWQNFLPDRQTGKRHLLMSETFNSVRSKSAKFFHLSWIYCTDDRAHFRNRKNTFPFPES